MRSLFAALVLCAVMVGCYSPVPPDNPQQGAQTPLGADPYLDLYREVIDQRSGRALAKPSPPSDLARQDLVWSLIGSILSISDMGAKPASGVVQATLEGRNLKLLDHVPGSHDRLALVLALINADLAASDPHSQYLPPVAVDTLDQRLRLFDEGLGIMVVEDEPGTVVVSSISDGSPASKEKKLAVGHVLRRVSNENDHWYSPKGEDQWRRALSGAVGSLSGLEWVDNAGAVHTARLRRTWWSIESQRARARIIESTAGRLALVSVPAFYDRDKQVGTLPDIEAALQYARNRDARILVLDLRGNRGGEWHTVIGTASLVMPGAILVNALSSSLDRPLPVSVGAHEKAWTGPIWVWVDQHTASGGEILAGSLREAVGACVVGERTFGKATMQERIDIKPPHGGQLLVTTALYTWPSGKTAQWTGVEPDVWMSDPALHDAIGERAYPSALVPYSRDVSTTSSPYSGSVSNEDDWILAAAGAAECQRQ